MLPRGKPDRMTHVASVSRMIDAAAAFRADAAQLSAALTVSSGSYLLQLVAFEILLKALLHAHGLTPPKTHEYAELFGALPVDVRTSVIARAGERMSTSADFSDIVQLLSTFTANFKTLRYPYEAYSGVSAAAYAAAGHAWAAKEAPNSEAVFVYCPEELFGLTEALEAEAAAWVAAAAPE